MVIKPPKYVTTKQMESIIGHQLPYEVQMMRALYPALSSGRYDQMHHNAHIESFYVHARNLVEFFKAKNDVDPRIFTDDTYRKRGDFIDRSLQDKMNEQISHLSWKRTENMNEKLGPAEWKKTLDALELEIVRFEKAIKPEFRNLWQAGLRQMNFQAEDPEVLVDGSAGASSDPSF